MFGLFLGNNFAAHPTQAAAPGAQGYGAGLNGEGELGIGGLNSTSTPTLVQMPAGVTAVEFSGSYYTALALGSDGNVYGMGYNDSGQVGDGTTTLRDTPQKTLLPAGVTATAISAGYYHSMALGSDGKVYTWGNNSYGEVGGTTTTGSYTTPVELPMPNGITPVAISANYYISVVLGSDGKVYSYGQNDYGQFGDNTTTNSNTPVMAQLPVDITAIATGYHHTLALGSDGKVYGMGYNTDGELGDGTATDSSIPVVAQLPNGVTATAISAHGNNSMALGSDGKVYTWGDNINGQIGDGTTNAALTPYAVQLPFGVTPKSISQGDYHSLVLGSDGHLFAWGDNGVGQYGDGTTNSSLTPTVVPFTPGIIPLYVTAGYYDTFMILAPLSASIDDVSQTEPKTGTTDFNFTVSLIGPAPYPVTIAYTTADGTATAPDDYTPTSGTLIFIPGETSKTITVAVNSDTVSESDETFSVVLSNPTNTILAKATGTGTILSKPLVKPNIHQPPADLVAQLRQTPDRVADNAATTDITYSFTVKNIGEGKAGSVSLSLPIDPQLSVGYASFTDNRLWVTSVTTTSISIAIPDLESNQLVTGTIVVHPQAEPQPSVGGSVTSQASVKWTNPGGDDKQVLSNRVSFTFGEAGSVLDVSGGQVQLMTLDTTTTGKAVAVGTFWIPNEPVSAWLTNPDGTSTAISQGSADGNGTYTITVDTTKLAAGSYVIAAYGQRSEVYGSAVLTVEANGASESQARSAARLTLKTLADKALVKAR
ncbi:MAG: hypothetical protein J0I20_21145 [Chloroflexi bacterium]|nr:hypothetical protein [Chloroflexota bacterium]